MIAGALVLSACGGGGGEARVDDTSTTSVAGRDSAVDSIEEAKAAVVQIVTQGSFRDPEFGQTATAGSGSGFIIDPDGIIVTNNHVVTGAGAIKVRIGGSDEEIPARLLGVSECNDLAVIQLTDPGPYPYLEWYEGEVEPPLEVYAAGFPLGDPEYTVTRGVVSKAEADGNTSWASVRHVIEHDANIQPGNSGGPLLSAEGKVVAVNYAGGDPGTGTAQFFAIAGDLARPVVERLQEGSEDSIGVNGEAVVADDGSIEGVWVAGVAAGSPAAKAGVLPGDIITSLNGVLLGGGTLEPYCDVLRSAGPDAAIGIQVLRFDTQEVLEGELNGAALEPRFSFADELGGDVPADGESYSGYRLVTDDTGSISVEIPNEWRDVDTRPQDINGTPSPSIQAAPNLDGYRNTYDVPGLEFVLIRDQFTSADIDPFLDALAPNACTSEGRSEYSDPVFSGRYEVWSGCGGGNTIYVTVAATPIDNPNLVVVVIVQAVTQADLAVLDQVLNTFNFA